MTLADVLGTLRADSPVLLVLAVAVLSAAAATGRRVMASARRQGERIGALEALTKSEQTRRRQVEAELIECGVPLPYWPEDPLPPPVRWPRRRDDEDQDQDHALEDPLTREGKRPPVPHRRHPADRT